MATTATSNVLHRGIVKQILSGDSVVIRGQPKGGPPPERTLCLSNVEAPRLGRRPNPGQPIEVKDAPCAWEAREFLRRKLIGKEVCFTIENKVPSTNREYGYIWLGKDKNGENVCESLVNEGLVSVRKANRPDETNANLLLMEENAKLAGRGKWAADADNNLRNINWVIDKEKMRNFVDSFRYRPIKAIIEHVRDGCTVRALLLPKFDYVTLMLTGIRTPMFKQDGDKMVAEEFAEEAKFFVESRLLQQDVEIILEGTSGQNFLGTVKHPNGNISELLLREGFAKCVDWSMGCVTNDADKLRAAEKIAKDRCLRLWKDYKPSISSIPIKHEGIPKVFQSKVTEIVNGDALVVKMDNGAEHKLFLASIRPPKLPVNPMADNEKSPEKKKIKPLFDIPYMWEAREFLRKKLIGKRVKVLIDFIQPASKQFPEKICCTILIGDSNVGEALVAKGLATVVKYRQDDDQRASSYDSLLAAENRAEKKGVGLHNKKDHVSIRVQDLTGNLTAARQFLPSLQRSTKIDGLVEFVASGSRLRIYMPRNTCLATVLLSGINCPRGQRPNPTNMSQMIASDEFGDEATELIKGTVLQHDVQVSIENMDKGGNFIGYVYTVDGVNLSELLVSKGLAKVHFTADKGPHSSALHTAETLAQDQRIGLWKDYDPSADEKNMEGVNYINNDLTNDFDEQISVNSTKKSSNNAEVEHRRKYEKVCITTVKSDLKFYAQLSEKGPALEKLLNEMRNDLELNPPLTGAYRAKKGDFCACRFSEDNLWYRGKVLNVNGNNVQVLFIDFGNEERKEMKDLTGLSTKYMELPPIAKQYSLACIRFPSEDAEIMADAVEEFQHYVNNVECLISIEYKQIDNDAVQLLLSDSQDDVASHLLINGYVIVDDTKKRDRRLKDLFKKYVSDQEIAKTKHVNIWRYGDITIDDAKEFGFSK